eukprot:Opistho-2@66159
MRPHRRPRGLQRARKHPGTTPRRTSPIPEVQVPGLPKEVIRVVREPPNPVLRLLVHAVKGKLWTTITIQGFSSPNRAAPVRGRRHGVLQKLAVQHREGHVHRERKAPLTQTGHRRQSPSIPASVRPHPGQCGAVSPGVLSRHPVPHVPSRASRPLESPPAAPARQAECHVMWTGPTPRVGLRGRPRRKDALDPERGVLHACHRVIWHCLLAVSAMMRMSITRTSPRMTTKICRVAMLMALMMRDTTHVASRRDLRQCNNSLDSSMRSLNKAINSNSNSIPRARFSRRVGRRRVVVSVAPTPLPVLQMGLWMAGVTLVHSRHRAGTTNRTAR